jgi:hypothetical protein
VLLPEHILADKRVQIDVHELEQDVDVALIGRADHLLQLHYVRVLEFLQEHYLAVGPLRVSRVLEGVEVFLQSEKLAALPILHLPDDAVSTTTDFLDDFEAFAYVRLNLLVLAHYYYQ